MKKLLEIIKKLFGSSSPSEKAFTLIELLVVIAILGVLAAGVLIAVNPAARISAAKDTNAENNVAQTASALETYFTDNQSYPATTSDAAFVPSYIKSQLLGPTGAVLTYQALTAAGAAGCTTAADTCQRVALSFTMQSVAGGATLYCWKSATGAFTQGAACAP